MLVRACVAAGVEVEVLPGPSAALAALVASALPADHWRFEGFLPRKKGELRSLLAEPGGTLVAFESPAPGGGVPGGAGLARSLAAGGGVPRADQGARGGRAGLGRRARGAVRGVAPARRGGAGDRARLGGCRDAGAEPAGLDALRRLVEAGARPRPAAAVVAELTGGRANELYRALTSSDE